MSRVAIVIVTHNSADHIGNCLASLKDFPNEIVVIDNASHDETCAIVRQHSNARLTSNDENRGFGAAVNQGVGLTTAPLLLLLNPDTREVAGISALAACFDQPNTGAAGGLLTNEDGSPQTGFMYRRLPDASVLTFEVLGINKLWPRNPVNWNYRCLGSDPMVPSLVEQPAGAFLMFSRVAWNNVGGFSENYWPIWFEDVDFCARLLATGFSVRYEPQAHAIHAGAHSIRRLAVEKRQHYWYGSLLEYAASHCGPAGYRMVCLAVASGAALRGLKSVPASGFNSLAVYGAVCRLALHRFIRGRTR